MMTQINNSAAQQKGFTLLEVLIAITLTGLVLGNLLALQSQSKRLSFRAQMNLQKNIHQRAYFNAAWINDRQRDVYMDEISPRLDYSVDNRSELEKPETQVQSLNLSLEAFAIVNQQNEVILTSVRLKSNVIRQ